jgi:hypothetical protein
MIPSPLSNGYLLLCEGLTDAAMLEALTIGRSLGRFEIAYPSEPQTLTGGRDGFGDILTALKTERGVRVLKGIIVISDNDDSPSDSFKAVQSQIVTAGDYGRPAATLIFAPSANGLPQLSIMMLPWTGQPRQLEDLCLLAAYNKRADLKPPLDTYCSTVVNSTWTANRESKMRLRVLMASHYHQPNTGFTAAWSARPDTLIPVSDPCFDKIATFLAGLP